VPVSPGGGQLGHGDRRQEPEDRQALPGANVIKLFYLSLTEEKIS